MSTNHSVMFFPVNLQCYNCNTIGAYGPFGELESCTWCGKRKPEQEFRGPRVLTGGFPGVVQETGIDEFGPETNMAKVIEHIPAMRESHRMLVLAEKEEYNKLLQPGEGPIDLMSVEYDHSTQEYIWNGGWPCHWRKEQENGMIEGIKEKDVKKANKFKLRIGGPWLYVLEYWEDADL